MYSIDLDSLVILKLKMAPFESQCQMLFMHDKLFLVPNNSINRSGTKNYF